MWNSRSYQLVSKHSILSAQRYNKVAAAEEFLEKRALHSKPEWKEELDRIKQQLQQRMKADAGCRWRRDHARCEELSETDFEIYLEMKLQWLQEYYVTAKSRKPEKKIKESEEGRDKIRETLERMVEILDSYLSNVAAKSSKSEERRETDESEKEERIEGSSGVPWNVIAKSEGDDISSDREPPNDQVMTEAQREEEFPDDSSSQATHSDETMTAALPSNDLGKICLSRETELCDGDEDSSEETTLKDSSLETSVWWNTCDFEKKFLSLVTDECDLGARKQRTKPDGKVEGLVLWGGEDEAPVEELTPEYSPAMTTATKVPSVHDLEKSSLFFVDEMCDSEREEDQRGGNNQAAATAPGGGTVAEVPLLGDASTQTLVLVTEYRDAFGKEKEDWVGWISRQVDLKFNSLGQAQYLLVTPPQFTNTRRMFQEEKGVKNGMDLFHINMCWQALHAHLPTSEHHIRMFNLPLESSVVTSLLDDQLISPTLVIKRLEELSLAIFLLVVQDENSGIYSNGLQLMLQGDEKRIKLLVCVGRSYSNGFGQSKNNSILLIYPLIQKWDPGGILQEKRDMNVVQLYVAGNITCKLRDILSYSALYFIANTIVNQRNYTYHDIAPSSKRVQLFHTDEDPSLGIWNKDLEPAWDAQHLNSNLQMNYGLSLSCNPHECQEPLFDYTSSLSMNGGKTAKENYLANGRDYIATNPSESLVTLETSMGGGAIFVTVLNILVGGIKTSLDWIPGQDRGIESQAWNHINPWVQGESEISKEAIELLYEWHMGLGDLTRTIENKLLELHDKEEERNSGFTEFGWHKLMVEHLIPRLEFSRRPMREANHKQWDPGELYSTSCIVGTSSFKLWDPGGRLLTVRFRYLHLEDKVNV